MRTGTSLLITAILLLIAPAAFCAEGLSTPRTNTSSNSLPISHVLRRQYEQTGRDPAHTRTVTESKYKDQAGRTVSVASTVGNLTTHKDPDGRVIGYTIAANGKSLQFDAHGRPLRTVKQ